MDSPLRSAKLKPADSLPETERWLQEAEGLLVSDPQRALECADEARRSARAAHAPHSVALADRLRGHAKKALDRHQDALEDYAASRRGFLRAGDPVEAARTLIGKIDALMYLDRFEAAWRAGRQALKEFKALGDGTRAGRVLMNLGNLEHRRDRPARAISLYERAREILAPDAPDLDLAFVDFNMGNILTQVGRFPEAEAKLGRAREVAVAAEHRTLLLFCDFGLAELDSARARFPEALRRFEDCQRGLRAIGHERGWCNCLLDRAEIYHNLSLSPEAQHAAEQAEAGFRDLGLSMEATRALFFRGLGAIGSGEAAAGRRFLSRAAREFLNLGNSAQAALVNLRRVQSRADRRAVSARDLRLLEEAKKEFRRQGLSQQWAEAQIELAEIAWQRGDSRGVTSRLNSASVALDSAERPEIAGRIAVLRARGHEHRGRREDALREAFAGLEHLELLRERLGPGESAAAHLAKARGTYQHLFRIFRTFLPEEPDMLFDILIRVEEAGATRRVGEAGTRAEKEVDELRSRLAALTVRGRAELLPMGAAPAPRSREVRKLERALLERTRRRRLTARAGTARSRNRVSAAGVQARLRKGDVWIHLVDQGDRIGALSVTPQEVRILPGFLSRSDVQSGLDRLRYHADMVRADALAGGRRRAELTRSANATLERLGETCLAPLEPALAGAARILIRPSAGLEAVPWGALSRGGAPLWEQAAVCLVAGARGFVEGAASTRADSLTETVQLWAAGSADLPGVDDEVRRVRRVLGRGDVRQGKTVTRDTFLRHATEATLLHFAGHGSFRADNPLFSSLRFPDGDLLFLDLERVKLRAQLVVLSACRSGQTRDELGIGAGLARGFLQAGARALVASLWRIGDRETSDFMEGFYADLLGSRAPEEALRRTALRLRSEGRHPADWAAFQTVVRAL